MPPKCPQRFSNSQNKKRYGQCPYLKKYLVLLLKCGANSVCAGLRALRTYRDALCGTVLITGMIHAVLNVAFYAFVVLIVTSLCATTVIIVFHFHIPPFWVMKIFFPVDVVLIHFKFLFKESVRDVAFRNIRSSFINK